MATANLGRIGFVNKGTYNSATAYKVNDVVTYNAGTYACIQANTGQAPTNTSYWQNWVADNAVHKTGDETINGTKTFTSSPIVPTPAAGDNSTKIATTAFTALQWANQSLATNGYQKLPGGLIIQWGFIVSTNTTSGTITCPIAFPNNILSISTGVSRCDASLTSINVGHQTVSQFQWYSNVALGAGIGFYWIAIGY